MSYRIYTLFFIYMMIGGCLFTAQSKADSSHRRPFTVVIDPGHGGVDSGAVSGSKNEKDITLAISQHIKKILTAWHIHTELSRNTDEFMTLKERTRRINRLHPAICISIHVNSSMRKSVHGFESFVYDKSQKANTKILQSDKNNSTTSLSFKPDKRHSESLQLAYALRERMLRRTTARDRGIKAGNFYLLKRVKAPCVLLEVGFLSNVKEGKKLDTTLYQQTIAEAIAEAIIVAIYGSYDSSIEQLAVHNNEAPQIMRVAD